MTKFAKKYIMPEDFYQTLAAKEQPRPAEGIRLLQLSYTSLSRDTKSIPATKPSSYHIPCEFQRESNAPAFHYTSSEVQCPATAAGICTGMICLYVSNCSE